MIQSPKVAKALQSIRIEHQESAGLEFPESNLTEMLVLYDVCKALDLTYFQTQAVLGAPAAKMVRDHINGREYYPTEEAKNIT